jgi:hypothetical protein
LLAVPLGVAAWSARRKPQVPLFKTSAACFVSALLLLALAALVAFVTGSLPYLAEGFALLTRSRVFSGNPWERALAVLRMAAGPTVAGALVHLAFWGLPIVLGCRAGRLGPRWAAAGVGIVLFVYAALLVTLYVRLWERSHTAYYLIYAGLCWMPLIAYPAGRFMLACLGPDARLVGALLFFTGVSQQALVTLSSSQQTAAGIPGVASSILLALLLGAAARRHLRAALPSTEPSGLGQGPQVALGLILATTAASFHFYSDQNPWRVPLERFAGGKLAGIYSSSRFVKGWSQVVEYLGPRVERGELLLALENITLLHYLTDTRPAFDSSYVTDFLFFPEQRRRFVETMVARGRVPRYAVRARARQMREQANPRYSTEPSLDPITAFLVEHYALEASLPMFDVYRRKPGQETRDEMR